MKSLLGLALCALLLCGCAPTPNASKVTDVSKPQVFTFPAPPKVVNVRINVKGLLQGGQAQLGLRLPDGSINNHETIQGGVDLSWIADWYSTPLVLEYAPTGVVSGNLTIEVRFGTL